MALEVPPNCPSCGLVLIHGASFDAMAQEEHHGPILGLHRGAQRETAQAGYIGVSSLYAPDRVREFYRCPRCGADPVIETVTDE